MLRGEGHRHEGVLVADRRFRTRTRRRTPTPTPALREADGDAQRWLTAFYNDLKNQGLLSQSLLLSFSEFGRRISENGSRGNRSRLGERDAGDGRRVHGGLFGTAPSLAADRRNPTLRNNTADVKYETDFRSAYAKVIDNWLGGDSSACSAGIFKKSGLEFV